jgi:drug/metabolite transporter (DMT)-like permease
MAVHPPLFARHSAMIAWRQTSENFKSSVILFTALVAFSAMTVLIKAAGQHLPLVEILIFRQLVMQLMIFPLARTTLPQMLRTPYPLLQIFRGLMQLGAMVASFAAVIHLPLAQSTAISFSYAIFVTLGAGVLLKEHVDAGRWVAMILGLLGVAIMLRPAGDGSIAWSLVAVAGAMFAAASALSLRHRPDSRRTDTVLTYQALVLIAALAIPTVIYWVTPSLTDWILLLAVGLTGTAGQWMLTVAYQRGEAAALAPLDFVRLVLTAICGFIFFSETPDLPIVLGAIVVVGATIYTVRTNARQGRAVRAPEVAAE